MASTASLQPALTDLQESLQSQLSGGVDFSDACVAMYTSDASNYRQIPLGVVFPESDRDIEIALSVCKRYKVPVLMRGAGTSQNGQTVNEAVILDCSRFMNKLVSIDVERRTAWIQPGIVCDALKAEAEVHGLTFGPDPATHSRCTLGGMIGNNSCGPHSMLAGKTVENVLELDILTPDGARFRVGPTTEAELEEIIQGTDQRATVYRELKAIRDEYAEEIRQRYPTIKRRVSGYNLDQLLPENGFNVARALVGSEGTCVSVLQAKVTLIENPAFKRLYVLGFRDIFEAGDIVPSVMPFNPIAMEGLDWNIIGGLNDRNLRQREVALLPEGKAWLLIELAAANESELQNQSDAFIAAMQASSTVVSVKPVIDPAEVTDIWSIREQGASATALALNPGDTDPVVGWEDTAVDPMQLGDYLRELYALVESYGYRTSLYGHFGDGCIHARMTFDTRTRAGVDKWRRFSREIAELVVKYNGSLSGEHGDGQAKAEFLPIMFGDNLMNAFRRFKAAWDPQGLMNPGKLIDAYRMDENLRFGPEYSIASHPSTLHFHEAIGDFSRATEHCIGMGKCRAAKGAMCPSYQATGEEKFSTRGRAHLLHELLRGDVITKGFDDKDIADSLEHCLSCKACKSECPTHVDIVAFKAEFMARHYKNNRRPLHHHLVAKTGQWLKLMTRWPDFFNRLQSGVPGKLTKALLDIRHDKNLPTLASVSFMTWVRGNAEVADDEFFHFGKQHTKTVVLWSDTVNNAYYPEILKTTVTVLNRIGYCVLIAKSHFCCGRPLYEHGFIDQAKQQLESLLTGFHSRLPENTSVIVVEPSCLSVFKDELHRLYPADNRALDLSNRSMTIAEFLLEEEIKPQKKWPMAIMHLHCHGKKTSMAERTWMNQCFEKVLEPESGCCGMAGIYGIRKNTAFIGDTLYARSLGQAIQQSADDTKIISNGYSCRKQIEDNTDVRVWHPIEIIDACLR